MITVKPDTFTIKSKTENLIHILNIAHANLSMKQTPRDKQCPICPTTIEKDTFVERKSANDLIGSPKYCCNRSCRRTLLVNETTAKKNQKLICSYNPMTLKGIFEIKDAEDIPDDVEKAKQNLCNQIKFILKLVAG